MEKYTLDNGLTILEEKKSTDSVTVQLTVKVGSNNEQDGIRGISHFVEHMVFEGTKKRKDAREISNEIEALGGEINAYTDNVRTSFYIKVAKKHFEKALDILSDIIINPVFAEKIMEKERKVILREINIFNDDPRHFQWILFHDSLFEKHPARFPAFGTRANVEKMSRNDLVDFYNKYYVAKNSILSVSGSFDNSKSLITKYFSDYPKGQPIEQIQNPIEQQKKKIVVKKRKMMNSYMVFGYKTVPRLNEDSYVLDVIQAFLGRGQSGRIFDEIRNKRGLAYEVGVHSDSYTDFGYFSIYLSSDKKNLPTIQEIILEQIANLQNLTDKDVEESIGYVEGRYILDNEDTHTAADKLGFWELIKDSRLEKEYLTKIHAVTKEDIAKVAKKYLTEDFTLALIEQQ